MTQTTTKTLRVTRRCIVDVELDEIPYSGPSLAVIEADQSIDYDILLRQIKPEENVISVEWTGECAGALVEVLDNDVVLETYEFEEDDLSELKDVVEKARWLQKR